MKKFLMLVLSAVVLVAFSACVCPSEKCAKKSDKAACVCTCGEKAGCEAKCEKCASEKKCAKESDKKDCEKKVKKSKKAKKAAE